MTIDWIKVVNVLPEEGKDYLVWNGHYMYVSEATFYRKEELIEMGASPEFVEQLMGMVGYFSEFGSKNYFNDKKVYYVELPKPPGVKK